MLRVQFATLATAIAATALLAAGCGGSSKTETTTSAAAPTATATTTTNTASTTPASATSTTIAVASGRPLSHSAWIAKGDSICTRANTKLSSTTVKGTADFARLLPQAAIYERTEAAELSKLVPPKAMAADWALIVNGLQKFSELSARAGQYAKVNNITEGQPVFTAATKVQQEFTAVAKRDGFGECSNP